MARDLLQAGQAVGERIQRARQWQGMSQRELASAVNVSVSLVAHWESGRTPIRVDSLEVVAEALGVPVEALVSERHHRQFHLAMLNEQRREIEEGLESLPGGTNANRIYMRLFGEDGRGALPVEGTPLDWLTLDRHDVDPPNQNRQL